MRFTPSRETVAQINFSAVRNPDCVTKPEHRPRCRSLETKKRRAEQKPELTWTHRPGKTLGSRELCGFPVDATIESGATKGSIGLITGGMLFEECSSRSRMVAPRFVPNRKAYNRYCGQLIRPD